MCLIIDSSASIRDNNPSDGSYDNWQLQLDFLSVLVAIIHNEVSGMRVGAVVFSEQVILEFALDTFSTLSDLQNAIEEINYLGQSTNTPAALTETRTSCFGGSGNRPDVPDLAILITDGLPFPSYRREPAIAEAEALKATGVEIIAIGVTDVIDPEFLRDISSPPHRENKNYFITSSFSGLTDISTIVASQVHTGKYFLCIFISLLSQKFCKRETFVVYFCTFKITIVNFRKLLPL